MSNQVVRARERVPTGRRGRPSKSMIAAAMERPFCAYLHKVCLNNRLEGHKYCIDHIMNDKTAPYRQCTFVHPITGRRCARAAHKVDRRASPLCHYHKALRLNAPHQSQQQQPQSQTNQPQQYLTQQQAPQSQQAQTPAKSHDTATGKKVALDYKNVPDLAHHRFVPPDQPRPQSSNTFWITKPDGTATPSAKLCKILADYNAKRQSEEVAPIELTSMEEIVARNNNADSDTESVDNSPDMFKHTSVFTEEELTRTLRDKMIKLRRLYIEQYGHIQYILKEKRLKYIQAQRTEDEIFGELYSFRNNDDSPDYDRLRAMLRYHKTFGPDWLLQEQAKRKKLARLQPTGPHPLHSIELPPTPTKCIFSKTAQGCEKPSLPLSPYCKQHILYDLKQVLFRPCAGGPSPCLTPVVSFMRKNRCLLHTAIN